MEYSYSESKQLSPHFNVSEFHCKCGQNHSIKIDSNLINKLESLFNAMKCSKIIVTSGYRCPTHDKNVGGTGTGQHTLGTAADVICYDASGKEINTKVIACAAQDIGFTGIGNIDATYTAIHLDTRTSGRWYGDETVNNNTLTDNFYNYYNLSKLDVYDNAPASCTHKIKLTIDGVAIVEKDVNF